MVERRPLATAHDSHLVLILGVIVVAFPLYITFVASTHTAQEIVQAPMPLLPGRT
jgi:sn-glycerol 3-phosphate transport system permease protein